MSMSKHIKLGLSSAAIYCYVLTSIEIYVAYISLMQQASNDIELSYILAVRRTSYTLVRLQVLGRTPYVLTAVKWLTRHPLG